MDKNTADVLFDSGERTLKDNFQQSIIFAQSAAGDNGFKAYYFYGSTVESEAWGDGEGQSQVRIFNAVYDETLENVVTTKQGGSDLALASGLQPKGVTDYESLHVGQYDFLTDFVGGSISFQPSHYLESGAKETIIVTGRIGDGESLDTIKLTDDQRLIATKSRVSFVNLAYESDEENYEPYDVHLTTGTTEDMSTRTPEISSI